ncbi:hypothetical protein ACQ4PT_027629 [Festuca glaucescens]
MVIVREDKGKAKASTAEEMETASENKEPLQIEEEMSWEWEKEGDCLSTDGDDDDDAEDEVKAVIPDEPSAAILGNCGVISVLFETPSGFAIFGYYGTRLLEPDALQHIWADFVNVPEQSVWLKEFQPFEDKFSTINRDTISPVFAKMIKKHTVDGQTLAVGKEDYAVVIDDHLGVNCLFSPAVEEMMWGLEIQMRYLVPEEKSELPNGDRFRMSKGMSAFLLDHHNFNVKPDMMVTKRIIEMAAVVYECDRSVQKHDISLRHAAARIEEISHIKTQGWDLLKIATALKLICYTEEQIPSARQLFTKQQLMTLRKDAHKYEDKFLKTPCLEVYDEMYSARKIRCEVAQVLVRLVEQAKKAHEAEEASGHEINPDSKKIRLNIDPVMIDELTELCTTLSARRKKRQVSQTLARVDALRRYTLISSHPLNKPNKPGILSLDIHPSQDFKSREWSTSRNCKVDLASRFDSLDE